MRKMTLCAGVFAALLADATAAPPLDFEPGVFVPSPPALHGEVLALPPQAQMFGGVPMQMVMLAEQLDLSVDQRQKAGAIMDRTAPTDTGFVPSPGRPLAL